MSMTVRRELGKCPLTAETISMNAMLPLIATVTAIAAPVQFQTASVYGNLFDGRTLTGWRATGNASIWTVKDGAIVGINDERKSGSTLYTKTKYEDLDLSLKVMWTGVVDSGVFLRKQELQVQVQELQLALVLARVLQLALKVVRQVHCDRCSQVHLLE